MTEAVKQAALTLAETLKNTKPENLIMGGSEKALQGMLEAKAQDRPSDFTVTAASLRESGESYFVIAWETVSAGFGELTFYRKEGRLQVDNEGMSARFCKEVLAKLVDQTMPRTEVYPERRDTEKPQPYGHYEGHDLRRADMDVIWSIGATPRGAIEALCKARWGGTLEKLGEPLTGGDPDYTWGFRFISNGTGFKAAGVHVPGGVICTWWK